MKKKKSNVSATLNSNQMLLKFLCVHITLYSGTKQRKCVHQTGNTVPLRATIAYWHIASPKRKKRRLLLASPVLLSPQNVGNPSTIKLAFTESQEQCWRTAGSWQGFNQRTNWKWHLSRIFIRKADTRFPLEWPKLVAVLFLLLTRSKGRTGLGV
jgi:hypothetical protein